MVCLVPGNTSCCHRWLQLPLVDNSTHQLVSHQFRTSFALCLASNACADAAVRAAMGVPVMPCCHVRYSWCCTFACSLLCLAQGIFVEDLGRIYGMPRDANGVLVIETKQGSPDTANGNQATGSPLYLWDGCCKEAFEDPAYDPVSKTVFGFFAKQQVASNALSG